MQRNRIVVTGATGFVGSWLCRRLADAGHDVTGLVRRPPASDGLFARLGLCGRVPTHCLGDGSLSQQLAGTRPDTIINLAGQSQVLSGMDKPGATFAANTAFVWELLDAVHANGMRPAIVHASSDSVYGETRTRPAREHDPAAAQGPYAVSKLAAELVARCYAAACDLPVVVIRFGNIYGPGDPNGFRLIPDVLRRLAAGVPPHLRDGRAVRSYLHVDDAIRAIMLLAARAHEDGVKGEIFNVAGDTGHSTLDVVRVARTVCGRNDIEPLVGNGAKGEISVKLSSIEKIALVTGWRPTISLAEGLQKSISDMEIRP